MKKALGTFGALAFFVVVGFFMFKNRPVSYEPMKVINPTYFKSEGKIGRVVSRRFYTHFKEAKLIVLGSSPFLRSHNIMWRELIKASIVDGIEFDDVISIEGLPALTNKDRVFKELSKIELGRGRTLIHVPANEIWRKKIEQVFPQADYVFFQTPFSLFTDRQKALGLECQSKSDQAFACLAYKAGNRYYRKKLKENRLMAMMEQLGSNFYLIFVGEQY